MTKNIILLLALIFMCDIFCDEILSKFSQRRYKIKDFRLDLISYNESYYNFIEIKTYKYNRTTPAVNCTVNLKISIKDKLELVFQGYKFLSNEYRLFPLRFQENLKRSFDANAVGLRNVKKCGNFSDFYFYKDITYHLCNFVLDETRLPPLIPTGRYKIEIVGLYLNNEMAVANAFGEVYVPIEYPKN